MVIPARRQVGNTARQQEDKPKLRVAAYCRVSTDSDEQATSYEAQVEHYTEFIRRNPEGEFAGIYADDGISGTNTKKRDEFNHEMFDYDGKLTRHGEEEARLLQYRINRGIELSSENNEFYNNPRVQEYLKSFASKPKMKNEIASDLARGSVEARTDSINKTKSNFDEHTASLIRYYGKGSGNP